MLLFNLRKAAETHSSSSPNSTKVAAIQHQNLTTEHEQEEEKEESPLIVN
jgi:hypothetical protein